MGVLRIVWYACGDYLPSIERESLRIDVTLSHTHTHTHTHTHAIRLNLSQKFIIVLLSRIWVS